MRGPKGKTWPDDHDALLKDLVTKGFSYSQIATELNLSFRTSYTRNACIGRAKRMGIGSNKPRSPRAPRSRGPYGPRTGGSAVVEKIARKKQQVAQARAAAALGESIVEGKAQIKIRCAEVEPLHVSFFELQDDQCNYPYGDTNFTYCGHRPRLAGFTYCAAHVALTTKAA